MKSLSVALAVYNEERYLGQCLDSVRDIADEIIVVDGGSTDHTREIAKSFGAKIIQTHNPPMFHINKQKALDHCTGEWILQLDADEEVPQKLKKEIVDTISDSEKKEQGYYIPRLNIFWGHPMRKTGVYPDYVIRLFRRGKGIFPRKSVHEQIEIHGLVGYMNEPMNHYSYETMRDYWRKAAAYTSLTAGELRRNKTKKNVLTALRYVFVYPAKTFVTLFVRNLGFVDGIQGFLFSLFSALHHPIAYWKYITGHSRFDRES